MQFDKTQKRALVFVAGLLGLSWYMGNQFEKADMMRSEGKLPCCPNPSLFQSMRGVMCRECGKEDRIALPRRDDLLFDKMRSEADAYTYAYNEGHSDSRKDEGYQPTLASAREEARFRKILKQRAETFNAPYAGSGSLMNIGQDTSLGNFTSKELTESSAIHGDFNEASLNYSGHQNLQVRGAENFDAEALARDWKWKGIGWTPEEEATLSREEKEAVAEQLYNDWRAGKIKATDVDEYYERLENGAESMTPSEVGKERWVIPKEAYPRYMRVSDNNWAKDFYCDGAWVERHGDEYTLNWVVRAYKPTKVQRPAESVFSKTYPYTEKGWFNGYMRWAQTPMRGKNWSEEVQEKLGAFISKRAETFNASTTKKPKLTKTQLKALNMMKASTFYGSGGYAYVEVDNRGWKSYTTRPVQGLLDKGIITIPKNENRNFYGRVKSMKAYIVYLNPVAWEYPFRYDYDKSLSQVGNKIVQNKKIQQQEHARILKQRQDEENMTEDEMWDNLFANSPELKEIYGFGAETFNAPRYNKGGTMTYGSLDFERAKSLGRNEHGGPFYYIDSNIVVIDNYTKNSVRVKPILDMHNFRVLIDLKTQSDANNLMGARAAVKEMLRYCLGLTKHRGLLNESVFAETMTPSEDKVKVTKDVTPKGSKIIVEECVDIQAHKADATANFYRVRFRDPAEMSNFRVPAWAARAANTMGSKYYDVAGSKVTMGQDKSGNWKIQSIMVPKRANVDVDLALKIANHIQDRLEKEGRWASKKCQDNERVLIIR